MKVLFICTGNTDRSPTAEELFNGKQGIIAKSAGTGASLALGGKQVTQEIVEWADIILAMQEKHRTYLEEKFPGCSNKIKVLGIPDIYRNGDPALVEELRRKVSKHLNLGLAGSRQAAG